MSTNGHNLSLTPDLPASYMQAKNWITEYIEDKKLGPGAKLPSERILAEAIGFSRPTIARAITELVREGVLNRAERIGTYIGGIPSRRATARTATIGIVMPFYSHDPSSPDPAILEEDQLPVPYRRDGMTLRVLQGAMSVLKEAGMRIVIHTNRELPDEMQVLQNLPREGLDGAIIMPPCSTEDNPFGTEYVNIANSGLPVVLVDTYFPDCPLDYVVTDNLNGAKQAVEYLISQGHKRIAHFTDFGQVTSTMDREAGYRLALEEAGIRCEEQLICGPQLVHRKQWSFRYALEHCLRQPDPITAVFCHNDDVMLLTLREARSLGIKVPEEFAVAGFFDDSIPRGMEVPFTRMVQSKSKMGRIAAKLLIERLEGANPPAPRHVVLSAELIPASHH